MKLSDVTTIKTRFEDADFWLIRRGSISQVGKPVREYNPEHIGVKVIRTDLLLPNFLYYWFMHLHNIKTWEQLANGTLSLVNIRVSDVRNIRMSPK
jgi:choline kinase